MTKEISKHICEKCGSKQITMINHTTNSCYCYNCMPEKVNYDGFEYKKINQRGRVEV